MSAWIWEKTASTSNGNKENGITGNIAGPCIAGLFLMNNWHGLTEKLIFDMIRVGYPTYAIVEGLLWAILSGNTMQNWTPKDG